MNCVKIIPKLVNLIGENELKSVESSKLLMVTKIYLRYADEC